MIFAKLFLSVIFIIVSFVSYLYILKLFDFFKFSLAFNLIVIVSILFFLMLFLVIAFYIKKIKKYDVSRLDTKDIDGISKFLSFIPWCFVMLSVLFVFSVSAYEYRVSKDLHKFVSLFVFALPLSYISYYLTKIPLYEIKFLGFGTFRRDRFIGIFVSFVLLVFIHVVLGLGFIVFSAFYSRKLLFLVGYVVAFSLLVSIFIFLWDLVLRIKYIIRILRAPEVFDKFIPVLSNDELGLILVYLDSFLESKKGYMEFPEVFIGDNKVRLELGKQFCGCVWIKLFGVDSVSLKFSEKVLDDIQVTFSRIESKVLETQGYVAKFDGNEMFIIWGVNGVDWVENLRRFVLSVLSLYRNGVLDGVDLFKMGISSGRVFVGKVESINGYLPYFFGEAMIEAYVVGKYPKGDGIFLSSDVKDMFKNYEFVDKVRVKELDKIVEIYRLLI
ncbi:MAG: hypothetical protein ACK4F9_04695 [Brevinematia bacterium]